MRNSTPLFYDLTHADGMVRALVDYAEWNPSRASMMLKPFMPFLPEEILGPSFAETVFAMVHAFWTHRMEIIPVQKAVAMEFVEKSREMGAHGLSITLHREAGMAVSQQYAELLLKFSPGREGTVVLEVKYQQGKE